MVDSPPSIRDELADCVDVGCGVDANRESKLAERLWGAPDGGGCIPTGFDERLPYISPKLAHQISELLAGRFVLQVCIAQVLLRLEDGVVCITHRLFVGHVMAPIGELIILELTYGAQPFTSQP